MLWNLIAKNPFTELQEHMKKTITCVEKTTDIFNALFTGNKEKVKNIAKEISVIEHECDLIKQAMRVSLVKSIFMPIEKRDLLNVISNMDDIADSAEDVGVLLTMRWMELPIDLQQTFKNFLASSILVVKESAKVIYSLDRLLEAGFAGPDAEEISQKIDHVDRLEHECDKAQDMLGKKLFEHEDNLSAPELIMWIKIIEKVGNISNKAEKMINHVRVMLVIK